MRINKFLTIIGLTVLIAGLSSCEKDNKITTPAPMAEFPTSATLGKYFITNSSSSVFKIPIGISNTSDAPRTVNFSVSSPTGAAAGTQYTLAGTSVVIPAKSGGDSISLKGLFAGYPGSRKDTLVFKITGGDGLTIFPGFDTYKVVMQKYCDVNLAAFTGTYVAQDYLNGAPDGGPYNVSLTPGTATGTTGFVTLTGLWGVPSPSLRINMNWTDPAAFSTAVPTQLFFIDGTYGQVTTRPNGTGTFSSCDNTMTIGYENTVAAGTFGKYTTTLRK